MIYDNPRSRSFIDLSPNIQHFQTSFPQRNARLFEAKFYIWKVKSNDQELIQSDPTWSLHGMLG